MGSVSVETDYGYASSSSEFARNSVSGTAFVFGVYDVITVECKYDAFTRQKMTSEALLSVLNSKFFF